MHLAALNFGEDAGMQLHIQDIHSGPAPTASLIVLHGLGADGSDFVPFCDELDFSDVPGLGHGGTGGVRFVLPSAPVMPVSLNGGHEMPAWYDILPVPHSDRPGAPRREDEASLRRAQGWVEGLIEREVARGIASERIVLMGFSQGCAMALMAGLRSPHRLGGLVALSGYLPLLETTAAERHPANQHTPIFMAHGDHDDVVVPARGIAARDHLLGLGYTVDWHSYPMAHSLCMAEVGDIQAWLKARWQARA